MPRPLNEPEFSRIVPEGDSQERLVCDHCGWVHYENPKLVVGAVATWGDRVLLCRRSIDPRSGGKRLHSPLHHVGGKIDVPGGKGMADRLRGIPVSLVPGRGTAVKR